MLKQGVFRDRRFAHEGTLAKHKKEEEDGAKVSSSDRRRHGSDRRQKKREKRLKVTMAIAADITAIAARAEIHPRFLIIFSLFLLSFHISLVSDFRID